MDITTRFSDSANAMQQSTIRKITSQAGGPGFISFGGGKPAPSLFPLKEIYESTGHVLEKYAGDSMQYSKTPGFDPLRSWVADHVVCAEQENVLMVSGSQQAIDICGRVFINRGDKVALTAPTYTAALATLRVYGTEFIIIDSDEDGILPDSLEAALRQDPKFVYAIPNFMNPSGVYMSRERREQMVALCRQYGVPILEDNPYGELLFEGERLPNLFELDPEIVIYAGTFSKVVAPGFRIGWLIAKEPAVWNKLMTAKQTGDLQVSIYTQMLLYELVSTSWFDEQIVRVRDYYRNQRDLMIDAMDRHFPSDVNYEKPVGGMFIWCVLPEQLDAIDLLQQAIEEKVAFVPGSAFYANGQGHNTFRLSFSLATPEEVEIGIGRLGSIIKRMLAQTTVPAGA